MARKGALAYPPPAKFVLSKDTDNLQKGFLSCPSMRHCFEGLFVVYSPFSLQLRAVQSNKGGFSVHPVFPHTSISPPNCSKMIKVQPRDTWRIDHGVILQIASPYLFFADVDVDLEMIHPSFASHTPQTWQLIPGRFNIFSWQRPLNFAVEWNIKLGDFVLKQGDPLYFLRFSDSTGVKHELNEYAMSSELQAQLQLTKGITGLKKGTFGLMPLAREKRSNIRLLE